jgi:hypothetical protein
MSNIYRGPAIDASYQLSVHLAKWFQRRRFFRNQSIRNKNFLWQPCLLSSPLKSLGQMNWNLVGNILGGSSIHIAHLIPIGLQVWPPQAILVFDWSISNKFQRKRFSRNQPIKNKKCRWWPCLQLEWYEMSYLNRGPSIDASYQVSVHLTEGFLRRRLKYEKLADDRLVSDWPIF